MIERDEQLRFELICREIGAAELSGEGIGTYSEKRMHRTLKLFFCPDESCHEVRIRPDGSIGEVGGSGRGGYIADICHDGDIIEIQTGGFYSLKPKLRFYLERTELEITVVHPLAAVKYTSWISPEDGSVTSRRRSPKRECLRDALPELFWLSDMLCDNRLHFCFPMMSVEEFRLLDGWSRDKKRGSNRYERIPTELIDIIWLDADNLPSLLPDGLPNEFTAAEFSRIIKFKGRKLYNVLALFCAVGVIQKGEKKGRAYVYRKCM